MRNLLTPSYKHKLRQEYLLRLTAVAGWMLTIAMVIGVLALLPAYVLSQTRLNSLEDQYEVLQASVASLTSDASAAPLTQLKKKLEVLAEEKRDERLTEALLSVLTHRTEGVRLTSFNYHKTDTASLTLRGVAASREVLLAFERALESDGRFEAVELPVSNLAQEQDIDFELTLSGKF